MKGKLAQRLIFIALILPVLAFADFETLWEQQAEVDGNAGFQAVTLISQERIACVGGFCPSGSSLSYGYIALYDDEGNNLDSVMAETDGWSELAAVVPATGQNGFYTAGSCFVDQLGMQVWVARWDDDLNLQWEGFFGGIGEDFGYSLVALEDGSCLVLSSVSEDVESFHNAELMKISAEGDSLWAVQYSYLTNDEGKDIIAGNDGTFYIAGASSQFDGVRNSQLWVMQIDGDGNVLEEQAIGVIGNGATDYDAGFGIVQDDQGVVTAVGITAAESQERMDAALVRLESDLEVQGYENYEMQGFYDFAYKVVAADSDGDVVICGASRNFNDQKNSGFLLRADASLDEMWRNYYSIGNACGLMDLCKLADNDFICVGYTFSDENVQKPLILRIRDRYILPDFEIGPCTGHAPLNVNFENHSRTYPHYEMIQWDFNNDGVWDATDDTFQYAYTEPGIYQVNVRLSGAEVDTTLTSIETVYVFNGDSGIYFDGESSRAQVDAADDMELTDSFTFEAWIDPSSWNNANAMGDVILGKGSVMIAIGSNSEIPVEHALMFNLRLEDGTSCVGATPDGSITLDGWQNIAVVYSGDSGVTALIDGHPQQITWINEPSGSLQSNASLSLSLGAHNAGFAMYHGVMDEVRLWSIARSTQEILETMELPLQGFEDGLLGYWRMDEAIGYDLTDGSLYNHHGHLSGTQWRQGCNFDPYDVNDETAAPSANVNGIRRVYPNPFNPSTTIEYALAKPAEVILSIYNVKGQKVKNLIHARGSAGLHQVCWDGSSQKGAACSSGIYLVRMQADGNTFSSKILMLK